MSAQSTLPRVSCIIAVYNGEAYVHEAIDSLLAQDYPHVEIIVVNDGSTDGTADILGRYGDRVRAFSQDNAGVSAARNRGVAMSTGQLLCFLDADDRLDTRKLTMQVAAFGAETQLDLCDCHTSYFWSPELSLETCERDFRYALAYWRNPLPGHISTWLFRRELWDRVGGFSTRLRYAEDVDWFSRARDLSVRRLTLAGVLTHRRLHPDNVTARCGAEQGASLAETLRAHLERARRRKAG
jgi:glycosyltransferase involved in cell wall biosynthesis